LGVSHVLISIQLTVLKWRAFSPFSNLHKLDDARFLKVSRPLNHRLGIDTESEGKEKKVKKLKNGWT